MVVVVLVAQSCPVKVFLTPWTVASQTPLSTEFSRQQSWSGLPFPFPGDLPDPGWNLGFLHCGRILHYWATKGALFNGWVKIAQSCPTLCDPVDCSLPGSSVHGILQARILEWVAISFSRGSSRPGDQTRVSRIAGRRFTIWATREAI